MAFSPGLSFSKPYRQAGNMLLFTCSPWIVAFGRPTLDRFGKSVSPFAFHYQGSRFVNVYETERLNEVANAAMDKLASPSKFQETYRAWLSVARRLEEISWRSFQGKTVSLAEVWKSFVEFWGDSVFIDCFDAGVDFSTMQVITSEHDFSREEVQTLTTPLSLSYLQEVEERACQAALSEGDCVSEFLRDFFWVPTDYVNFGALSKTQAVSLISSKKPSAERTLRLLEQQSESLVLRQEKILSPKGLSENPLWFFQNLVAWRDVRKRCNFAAMYGFDRLCREALADRSIDPELFGSVWPPELLEDRVDEKTLLRRKNQGVLVWAGVDSFELIEGKKGASLWSVLENKTPTGALQLRGNPACLGRVIGRVRIVRTPNDPFEPGEILVTVMTRPEFVPLMKKAAGIITDEGGITSHAAVVSRELNTPCIVGTQSATRDLKNGDLVELDAFHGLVKKTNLLPSGR